jgi:hypothetical protein
MIDSTIFRPVGAPPPGYPYAQAILEYGNINMLNRPRVVNADGSISTVRSIGFSIKNTDGGRSRILHILIPTVHDDGYIMTDEKAIKLFKKTENHLGIFATKKDINRYAVMLHDMEQARINGEEYEQPFSSPDQTAIYDAITSFRVSYGLSAGAEISVDFADFQGNMFKNNYFQIGQQYFYRNAPFQMASVEVGQGEGEYWNVRCKLRTWQQQQMKEDLHPEVFKSANGFEFAQKVAQSYGLGFVGEEVKGKQQQIKVKAKNNKESVWDVLQRAAGDNQYYCFIADGNLFFCSPKFLLGNWGIDEVPIFGKMFKYIPIIYPTPETEKRFLVMGLPEMKSSFDSPKEGEGSAQLWRDNATQIRAGMTVYVKNMGAYDGGYIISSVEYAEGEPEPISISFSTVEKLAPEDQKKVDEKVSEITVISGSGGT